MKPGQPITVKINNEKGASKYRKAHYVKEYPMFHLVSIEAKTKLANWNECFLKSDVAIGAIQITERVR